MAFLCCPGYSGYHGNQVNQEYILSQGTYVPNMDLGYSHKAELLHSLLVAMVTVLPWQQCYLFICIASNNICGKYEVKPLSFGSVIAVARVTVFP